MGIRFNCPNGHKLNVKDHLAGKRGVCPDCGAKFVIPAAGGVSGQTAAVVPTGAAPASSGLSATRDANRRADTDLPSIEIDVTESRAMPVPPPASVSAALTPAVTPLAVPPVLDFSAIPAMQPEQPVSSYFAKRQRSRRLQMKLAIALLVAVIVLAAVLIWVLRRGPVGPAAQLGRPTYLAHLPAAAYLAETRTWG
jgi:hypothetical protein